MVARVSPSWIVTSWTDRVPSAATVSGFLLEAIAPPRATGWAREASAAASVVTATFGVTVLAREAAVAANGRESTSTANDDVNARRRPRKPSKPASLLMLHSR